MSGVNPHDAVYERMLPWNAEILMLAECFASVVCVDVFRCDVQQKSEEGVIGRDMKCRDMNEC